MDDKKAHKSSIQLKKGSFQMTDWLDMCEHGLVVYRNSSILEPFINKEILVGRTCMTDMFEL